MTLHPFSNQGLFSDYYLTEVLPADEGWRNADQEAAEAQADLRALWDQVGALVTGHEGQTEEHWVRPVLTRLGFSFQVQTAVEALGGGVHWPDYALFHSAEARDSAQPALGSREYFDQAIAIADAKVWDRSLDTAAEGPAVFSNQNPNFQVDAYLRETRRDWAVLTNGRIWRLYNRESSYKLNVHYGVDLIEALQGDAEAFKYFWLLFRRDALVGQPNSFCDRVRRESDVFAERLARRVKDRVYDALRAFINGFLRYPANGLAGADDLDDVYANSLILLYRLLFAFHSESRGLLPTDNPGYVGTYSLAALKRQLAERLDGPGALLPTTNNYYADLRNLFALIDQGSEELGVPAYNGGLFDRDKHAFLDANHVGDYFLARGIDALARVPTETGTSAFVDYSTLEIRHLGDIYEGLLEYHPRLAEEDMVAVQDGREEYWMPAADAEEGARITDRAAAGECFLATGRGERRATGSYYTPQDVVAQMVARAITPTLTDLPNAHEGEELTKAFLALRVCDPAMGSGHFLVESVDQIARAMVTTGAAGELGEARRQVVERCVYGIDLNPLAVELAKLSLWLATVAQDRPLSFLDAHLKCGDALLGARVADLGSLSASPGEQMVLVEAALGEVLPNLLQIVNEIEDLESASVEDVETKEALLESFQRLQHPFRVLADVWVAKRFGVDIGDDAYLALMTALGSEQFDEQAEEPEVAQAAELARNVRLFHWELEFPEIFMTADRSGFDAVVMNPPYVNATELNRTLDSQTKPFWRTTFDSARGAYDLYVLFVEQILRLLRTDGRAAVITPNKYLAAPYAEGLRNYIRDNHQLEGLIDGSRAHVFEDPSVYPVISLLRAGATTPAATVAVYRLDSDHQPHHIAEHPSTALDALPQRIWGFLLVDSASLLLEVGDDASTLEDLAGVRVVASTTTNEADRFGPHIREAHLAASPGWHVINTGTIETYASTWGHERFRHQGRNFLRPVLPFSCEEVPEGRSADYNSPKLIFAKVCDQLKAVTDQGGSYAGLNVNFVVAPGRHVGALAAVLNSTLMRWIYEGYFGALRMSGGYLQVQAPQLRVLPMPAVEEIPDRTAEVMGRLDMGDDPEVLCIQIGAEIGGEDERIWAELAALGTAATHTAQLAMEARGAFLWDLMGRLGVRERRNDDPSWVLPRQERILAELERDVAELTGLWEPLRQTARQLRVQLGPAREQDVTEIIHAYRPVLIHAAERLRAIQGRIDARVYSRFGLTADEVSIVERGPELAPGIAEAD